MIIKEGKKLKPLYISTVPDREWFQMLSRVLHKTGIRSIAFTDANDSRNGMANHYFTMLPRSSVSSSNATPRQDIMTRNLGMSLFY